ncbi:Catechol 1,2-dioxygenase [Trametes pubescens]|uniref:Catechol 1,2-dioxygenase n=1 Tax=Trametes pubescens TaxID=154538 RepID=A0A1M2W6Y4_TRAPU|nr:Catechol 1,2-dioxygenase [Trametes pubescens]
MSQVSTIADWAPSTGVSLFTRVYSALRSSYVMFVVDNPLSWTFGFRGQNAQDDVEGPYYIPGSPYKQIEDGKAVMASTEYLKKYGPFLFLFDVKDAKGDPVPNATLDWWQADSDGGYYFRSWTLRGKVTTDAHGRAEVLSVNPGEYGIPLMGKRSGHVHLNISGSAGKHRFMTTQVYVCEGNRSEGVQKDMANFMRAPRAGNLATCWSLPAANGGQRFGDFPQLPKADTETAKRIDWWNAKLKERGVEREVLAVGQKDFKLTLL